MNGNNTKIIYPSGKVITKSYDEINRLVNTNIPHPSPLLTGEGTKGININFNYSGLELLNQINSNNTKTTYSYDELSRLKELNSISIEEVKKGDTKPYYEYQYFYGLLLGNGELSFQAKYRCVYVYNEIDSTKTGYYGDCVK